MTNAAIVHQEEFALYEQTRADLSKAATAMTLVAPESFVDGFGQTITAPSGYTFNTPIGPTDFGETKTTISSTPVTIDGSTYTQSMDMSDRTHDAVEHKLLITGTGAVNLSWMVTGRDYTEGVGFGCQMYEVLGVGTGALGGGHYINYNPTFEGAGNETVTGLPPTPPNPIQKERDRRCHQGQSLVYLVSGNRARTGVKPMQFINVQPSEIGETRTRSLMCYGARQYRDSTVGYGDTLALKATCTRTDYYGYWPTLWTSATCNNQPIICAMNTLCCIIGGYWTEGKVYDLADFANPIVVPASFYDQRLSGVGGTDNFTAYRFNRKIFETYDGLVLTGQQIRTPIASPYSAIYMRNAATDIATATCCRFGTLTAAEQASMEASPGTFLRDSPSQDGADLQSYVSVWEAANPIVTAPTVTGGLFGVVTAEGSASTGRKPGWAKYSVYRLIGRSAHVLAGMQDLYRLKILDRRPENFVPGAVTTGTYWANAKLNPDRIRQRARMMSGVV